MRRVEDGREYGRRVCDELPGAWGSERRGQASGGGAGGGAARTSMEDAAMFLVLAAAVDLSVKL